MSVGEALDFYTGQIKSHQNIDMEELYRNIAPEEKERFCRLCKVVDLTVSAEYTDKFEKIYDQLKAHRDDSLSLSNAASFRKGSYSTDDLEDQREIDEIFAEEFGDDDEV
jgi:cyclophilin family peptidyl-prolyl cis-trans isomerase